jgi:FtsX-like permease family
MGRLAWWRFSASFRQRRGGYFAIVVIIALAGGLAMASVAAARRTQSAFPRLIAASNPSNLSVDPGPYSTQALAAVSHLPGVVSTKTYVALSVLRALPNGYANLNSSFNQQIEVVGSLNGLYFNQDRVVITQGRKPDPTRADEALVSEQTAQALGLHLNQTMTFNLYSLAQQNDQNFNPATDAPLGHQLIRITGIGVFTDEVVQDDIDRGDRVLVTPAFTHRAIRTSANYMWIGLKLRHGDAEVARVQQAYVKAAPRGIPQYFRVASVVVAQGERAVRPESIALGVFGLICGLAALVLGLQGIHRQIYSQRNDRAVLRSLGVDPIVGTVDAIFGSLMAIVVGSVLAVVVALALSPIAPLGPIHRLEVNPGISFDLTVLALGFGTMVVIFAGSAALLAIRLSPQRLVNRVSGKAGGLSVVRAAEGSGLPISAVIGVRYALQQGTGRNAVPVRSSIVGTALALVGLIGALTFGASLNSLVAHPALYGWNWDQMLEAGAGYGNITASTATHLLSADASIAQRSNIYFDGMQIDGLSVPVIAMDPQSQPAPPILSGHGLNSDNQIVLGAATLGELHKHIGDLVHLESGRKTQTVKVVGTATIPTIGIGHGIHPSLGNGAVVPAHSLSKFFLSKRGTAGPDAILIRFRAGTDIAAATRRLNQIASTLSTRNSLGVSVSAVQRPAEIVNYRSMGAAPATLGAGLALASVLALTVTLATSVRRRARDLAILKTLGFTRRQIAETVAWQSTVSVAIGAAIGVPLGIVTGRLLWNQFAKQIYVVPHAVVPTASVAVVVVVALVLANVVAAGPGRRASRTPTALVLRTE